MYLFVSSLTLLLYFYQLTYLDQVDFFETFKQLNLTGKIYLIFSNIFILGQDLAFFMSVEGGNMIFNKNYTDSEPIIYQGLISHVTWTISLEMCFYLIAPFVLRNYRMLLSILICSILLRVVLIYDGIGLTGGFTYRFFPLELALFLLGAFSHQFIKPYLEILFSDNMDRVSKLFTGAFIIYCFVFSFLPGIIPNTVIMVALLIVLLPFLFHFSEY